MQVFADYNAASPQLCGIALNVPAMRYTIYSGAVATLIPGAIMGNSPENKADQSSDQSSGLSLDQSVNEGDPVSDETHGNRAEEKIEDRAAKKQQTHEEAKSITGSEPHKDNRNEHPGEGPAPLDRY